MVRFVCIAAVVLMFATMAKPVSAQCVGGKCRVGVGNGSVFGGGFRQCVGGNCNRGGVQSQPAVMYTQPTHTQPAPQPMTTHSRSFSIAAESAHYRATHGIKGHAMHIEGGHKVGVGWSSHNPQPATCYNNEGGDYQVVRGSDGYYATRVIR